MFWISFLLVLCGFMQECRRPQEAEKSSKKRMLTSAINVLRRKLKSNRFFLEFQTGYLKVCLN